MLSYKYINILFVTFFSYAARLAFSLLVHRFSKPLSTALGIGSKIIVLYLSLEIGIHLSLQHETNIRRF